MGAYEIIGGKKLRGELEIKGGKNAILPILAATVLNRGVSIISNCPKISDSLITCKILESIGCSVNWEDDVMIIDSKNADCYEVPEELVIEMRSSIIFLGSILGRFKKVKISYPGGCELGARPIDLHLKALRMLGVEIKEELGFLLCEATNLNGARISLDFPSVGATENIMLVATIAEGETTILNAAKEPEIIDLQNFLNAMGAKIEGAGTDVITISGVKKLHDVEFSVMPDRIVAGTFLVAAAITGGDIMLDKINPEHIEPITAKLEETGCKIHFQENKVFLRAPERIKPVTLRTMPHPGFPTDMQPQFTALLTIADGTSIIIETVFNSRFIFIDELRKMGASVYCEGKTAIIKGEKTLRGSTVQAKDLRGGASIILAALAAEGKTLMHNSMFVERGYENIEDELAKLGADIRYIRKTNN